MTTMAVAAFLGVITLGALFAWFTGRRGHRLAETQKQVEREMVTIQRKDQELTRDIVDNIEDGKPIDQVLEQYQVQRAELLPIPTRNTTAWNWDAADLQSWKAKALRRLAEEINRRLLLPALGGALLVIAVTVTVIAVLYQFSAAQPAAAPTTAPDLPLPAVDRFNFPGGSVPNPSPLTDDRDLSPDNSPTTTTEKKEP